MTLDEARQRISPYHLTWPEVDPASHPFDPAQVHDVLREIGTPVPPPVHWDGKTYVGDVEARAWRDRVSHALVDRYGRWAAGWRWSVGEGDFDGGPVGSWCCVSHSMKGSADETLTLAADALREWRRWLEDLAERFDRFLPLASGDGDEELLVAWETAVAQLVVMTVDRTRNDSGWYFHCERVLGWFLTAAGIPEQRHAALIEHAIGGRFRSWVAPDVVQVQEVAERLARQVVDVQTSTAAADHWDEGRRRQDTDRYRRPEVGRRLDALEAWEAARARVDWVSAAGHVSGPARTGRDAVAAHVARRPDGAAPLAAALDQVRAAAAEGGPLTFALLAGWQATVLGVPEAAFRTDPASAKGGRERYHWRPDLPAVFEARLAEATDPAVPLPSRAARVYLDVAFFHPFDDGNARAAMLALYYVLAREGVVLDQAAPLLVTVRQAHDRFGAAGLAKLVELLIDKTRRQAG
ncbi:Fic family protein [Micromonospora auratinigra]|uniref:Fic/DOC family protein n=1 Tax=Micromonospora auratinigra TaxID=261654 RepID=A0A1A8Z9H1_9ACTN|nr:Fic family protein [Micromonospora auratinigra]SBT40506.1 Fic/DOC family protein [Micromonospora auratinigra]